MGSLADVVVPVDTTGTGGASRAIHVFDLINPDDLDDARTNEQQVIHDAIAKRDAEIVAAGKTDTGYSIPNIETSETKNLPDPAKTQAAIEKAAEDLEPFKEQTEIDSGQKPKKRGRPSKAAKEAAEAKEEEEVVVPETTPEEPETTPKVEASDPQESAPQES